LVAVRRFAMALACAAVACLRVAVIPRVASLPLYMKYRFFSPFSTRFFGVTSK
jgi:hypothetical protein